jgi:hypothetical protein
MNKNQIKFGKMAIAGVVSAIALTLTASPANALVLTFEGLGDEVSVGNYYNGGAGGNDGISFGSDSLSIIASSAGGSGNFSGNPSGDTVLFFLSGPGDVMDVAGGFNTGFSFFYADQVGFTGSVSVYSGLDGTGTQLATLSLPSTPNPYTVWDNVGVSFAGTAESVVFSGSANYIAFDDVTLGSAVADPSSVPDSGSFATDMVAGLALVGAAIAMNKKAVRC